MALEDYGLISGIISAIGIFLFGELFEQSGIGLFAALAYGFGICIMLSACLMIILFISLVIELFTL